MTIFNVIIGHPNSIGTFVRPKSMTWITFGPLRAITIFALVLLELDGFSLPAELN